MLRLVARRAAQSCPSSEQAFMLYLLIPLFVVFVGAVVYDVRRRHAPGHDIESAARRARADAEGRRAVGGH